MNRDEVLNVLRAHKTTLGQRFDVTELALFGSFARDQAAGDSDVDVLVRFGVPPDWERFFGAQAYLEDLLGRPVDLATPPGSTDGDTPLRGTGGDPCLMLSKEHESGVSTFRT